MARLPKFLAAGAVGAAAIALVVAGAGSTGAYFTDSHDGSINASTGTVKVNTSDLSLNFTKLLPGEFQTRNIDYAATGSGPEDIWLVLPATKAYTLNGISDVDGQKQFALGRYGHFAVDAPAGSFTSFNLAAPGTTVGHTGTPCVVNANGHGGSADQAATKADYPAYCPAPNAILLGSNLNAGEGGTAKITFGFTKLTKDNSQQGSAVGPVAGFQIVATQHGITPNDPNN